jgi:hypothetical protein
MTDVTIDHLIGHGHFFDKTFLNLDQFIRYCADRGLHVSAETLERFERLGVFLPLVRIRWPKIKIKLAAREDGTGDEELGMLQDGEEWSGEIREKDGGFFWWDKEAIQWLMAERMLWVPTVTNYQPWASYKAEDGWWNVHSYYSIFQTLPLSKCLASLSLRVDLTTFEDWSAENATEWLTNWKAHTGWTISQSSEDPSHKCAEVCQILSSRYLPYAQSDGATITLPHPDFFDWRKFRREWRAEEFLNESGLSVDVISECWETVNVQRQFLDPLINWQDFVDFVKPSQRERLKGAALLCQNWRTMERMLNFFYKDLTGNRQHEFDRAPEDQELFWGKGVPNNDLRFLEFLANRYGVNPRPKVLLVVEGNGEDEQIPRMAEELLSPSFPKLRIAIMNIKGVGEIKRLSRLIDHYHSLQAIVFVMLDNENNTPAAKTKLAQTPSQWNPKRTITKEEYIHIWNRNIEFDNFTDDEIAGGLIQVCEGRFQFSQEEIAICRERFGSGRDPHSELYFAKLSYGLQKPKLLRVLFDVAIQNPDMETGADKTRRPIVDLLTAVQHLALRNHQPSHLDAWQQTQDSDWLGNKITHNNSPSDQSNETS